MPKWPPILYRSLKRLLSCLLHLILFQVMLNQWCGIKTEPTSIIAEMSKQQHPVYCTCYNLLSSMWLAGACLAWNSPFTWLAQLGLVAQLVPLACNQYMGGGGRSHAVVRSLTSISKGYSCLSLGPRSSSQPQQIDLITAMFNLVWRSGDVPVL